MNLSDISNSLPTINKTKKVTFNYLKRGEGQLASDYYKTTKFAKQRKEKIIREQQERERNSI